MQVLGKLNPWLHLPASAPYVLAQDAVKVNAFNRRASERTRYDLTLLPEPFFGAADAPVLLLALNPGWNPGDAEVHARPDLIAKVRRSLNHNLQPYPFLHLQPDAQSPGTRWWLQKTRPLIEAVGFEAVAKHLSCIQYFPYHSEAFAPTSLSVPSQQYSFALVRSAIAREAEIIVMRSRRLWTKAVPELFEYSHGHALRNPRNPSLSRQNFDGNIDAVLHRLRTGV